MTCARASKFSIFIFSHFCILASGLLGQRYLYMRGSRGARMLRPGARLALGKPGKPGQGNQPSGFAKGRGEALAFHPSDAIS